MKGKLSVKTLNERCKALKTSKKTYLIRMLAKSMESYPIQFQLGSKIKGSISKFWKTVVPTKNKN